METLRRGLRSALRHPIRLALVVMLLGGSVMFVALTMNLSSNSQQELASVHKLVGTTITINYAVTDANQQQTNGGAGAGTSSGPGGGGTFSQISTPIPNSVVNQVKHVVGVVGTQESLQRLDRDGMLKSVSITAPNGQKLSAPLMISGISGDAANFTLIGIMPSLVSGRGFRGSDATADVAMMSQAIAQANNLHVGSTFTLHGTTFTLIGLYTTSNQLADSSIVIPLTTMQNVFGVNGVDSITATAASYEQVDTVAARIRTALGSKFDVVTQADQYHNVFSALQLAQNSIRLGLVISLVIAAAVTIFAVLTLVRERIGEIAILRTLGASHWQVLRQFWTEIVAPSVLAIALAVLLLVTLGQFLSQRFDIDASSLVNADAGGPSPDHPLINIGGVSTSTTSTTAANLSNLHLAAATLNAQTLLVIVGVGVALALVASLIPTWVVSNTKPARVLRMAAA